LLSKKGKLITIISSVVSLVLCLVIVLLTVTSCSDNKDGGKTVKRVVKKKIIVVEEPEGESKGDMTIYDVVDEEYDGPEEVVDTVVVPEYEVELEGEKKTPLESKIAIGFYAYNWGQWEEQFGEKFGKESEFLTVGNVGTIEKAKWAKERGVSGFITPLTSKSAFVSNDSSVLSESWKENVLSTAEAFQVAGLWDVVEGYHFDEPLLKLSGEQFREMTKFLAETFPDKRIFPVHCNYEINGTSMSGSVFDTISYDTSAYCTDIGYDNYHSIDIEYQREMIEKIKEMAGRKDIRIWLFPTTFVHNSYDEEYMLAHLNMYYKLLMEQENPGGLYLYSWKTYGEMTGFAQLTDPNLEWKYNRLLNRVVEIGKELKNAEYNYKTTKN